MRDPSISVKGCPSVPTQPRLDIGAAQSNVLPFAHRDEVSGSARGAGNVEPRAALLAEADARAIVEAALGAEH